MKKTILLLLCLANIACAANKNISPQRQVEINQTKIDSFLDDYYLWGIPLRKVQSESLYVIPDFFTGAQDTGYSVFYAAIPDSYIGKELYSHKLAFVPWTPTEFILRLTLNDKGGTLKPIKAEYRYDAVAADMGKVRIPNAGVVFKSQIDALKKELVGVTRVYAGGSNVWEFNGNAFVKPDIAQGSEIKVLDVVYGKHKVCFPQEDCYPYFVKLQTIKGIRLVIYGEQFNAVFPASKTVLSQIWGTILKGLYNYFAYSPLELDLGSLKTP
jgi:hypothetical protein